MASTYEPIATTTLGTSASTITFSSIPATYTDLRLVLANAFTSYGIDTVKIRFNGDTGSNYSDTYILGDGSAASSGRATSQTSGRLGRTGYLSSAPGMILLDIFSYAGSTNKSYLSADAADTNGGVQNEVSRTVGLWRDTAAITSIELRNVTFQAGATATLYGIKNA
jgi:hypothetical protein